QWCLRKIKNKGWLSKLFWKLETRRAQKWESHLYKNFTVIYAPSSKDLMLLNQTQHLLKDRLIFLQPPFNRFKKTRTNINGQGALLFWGSLRRKENLEGVLWLYHQVFPLIKNKMPEISLNIVGANPPSKLYQLQGKNVSITGFVEDPTPYFANSDLAVLPLFEGAGIKIKVLECLASGIPVITTKIGAEGLDAKEDDGLIVLNPEPEVFAQEIFSLLSNGEKLKLLSLHASEWALSFKKEDIQLLVDPPH